MATLHLQLDFLALKGPGPLTPQHVCGLPPKGPQKLQNFVHIGRRQPQLKIKSRCWDAGGGEGNLLCHFASLRTIRHMW